MQMSLFDGSQEFKIDKPIRLISLFSGYDSQALALEYLGVEFEHWKTCEWAVKSIQALKDLHFGNNNTDYSKDMDKQELIDYLTAKGISANYNEPMTYEQVRILGEDKLRRIYNNIKATHNLVNIQQVNAQDLEIVNTDNYCYIMTYSFPCQDLSKAGKGAGMAKDSGTRSGMLWEVEKILDECGNKPQVLLMENVPDVIGSKNIKHFAKWLEKLESLGYKCYWKVLNAKDYGIPQNRERCFMISILGDYYYEFPENQRLELRLKDLLENEVDDKYYLRDKMIKYIVSEDDSYKVNPKNCLINRNIACSKTTRETQTRADCSDYICDGLPDNYNIKEHTNINVQVNGYVPYNTNDKIHQSNLVYNPLGISPTLNATDYKNPIKVEIPQVIGGIGEKKSNGGTQYYQQDRNYDDNIAISVTTAFNPYYKDNLRIRKLIPKECFRLMGVKDEDFEKVQENQSNSSLYHLAGDSIVVNVLMAIFGQML